MPDTKTNQPSRMATAKSDIYQLRNVYVDKDLDNRVSEWASSSQLMVSPKEVLKRRKIRDVLNDSFSENLESSFDLDCNSSLVSLDFGLVSPKKMWSSPPQRIERAQNREWSSPHRIVDRPNPENSPGNWVTFKESRIHSLPTVVTNANEKTEASQVVQPRSISQTTYVVPDSKNDTVLNRNKVQTTRITSVLQEYEPEKKWCKKKTSSSSEHLETNFPSANEKVKRLIEPDGHVVKISLLNDFEVPCFGKLAEKLSSCAETEKISIDSSPKNVRSNVTSKAKVGSLTTVTSKLHPPKPTTSTKIRKVEKENNIRKNIEKNDDNKIANENELNRDKENEDVKEDIKSVRNSKQVIKDLEEILRGPIVLEKEKSPNEIDRGKIKTKKIKPVKKHLVQTLEEKPLVVPEKKKRYNDEKVQEFIKSQKQKRLEQIKLEKRFKVAEKEARKKKLEELRIKTLKLAAQSKKKKASEAVVEAIEQNTEEDITMSLGLKQSKPKVSYNESISNLKKKTGSVKAHLSKTEVETLSDEGEKSEKEQQQPDNIITVQSQEKLEILKKPEEVIKMDLKPQNDINATLRKLVETLHEEMEEKKKQFRTKSSPSILKTKKDIAYSIPSKESFRSVQTVPDTNSEIIAVDIDTIYSLKEDIKKISENFKVLHEIIIEKTDFVEEKPVKETEPSLKNETSPSSIHEKLETIPLWLKNLLPEPHPYNVCTAYKHKMNVETPNSVSSQGNSYHSKIASNKSFTSIITTSDQLGLGKQIVQKITSDSSNRISDNTSEENYFTLKEDSGSELSSSILDSDNCSLTSVKIKKQALIYPNSASSKTTNCDKECTTSSIITEITRSVQLETSKTSISSKSIISKLSNKQDMEDMVLVTPDIKLISNDLVGKKLTNSTNNINLLYKSMSTSSKNSAKLDGVEDLNNSESKSNKDQKSESVITEMIDNLSENEKSLKSLKSINEKPQNTIQRLDDTQRRSFFQPEMLHLQFQAELTLLETFQKSLSRFLEVERLKTLSEVNKIVSEKSIKPESIIHKEDQAVQTSFVKYESSIVEDEEKSETESVKTEISITEEESIKTEKIVSSQKNVENEKETSEISEKISLKSVENSNDNNKKEEMHLSQISQKNADSFDFSHGPSGISFQMLDRMMKDEELRSEHQLALIRLREKTLNEKVKAELTFLEMKKKAFKERGDNEQNVSAIKKKQRGILMKYQSEKEEIERLKKMHKIASEERKIMIAQQKQIQQMQLSTKDMIIKLKKKEKPSRKKPLKPKALTHYDSESDIHENIPEVMSDSLLTESVRSLEDSSFYSNESDAEISSKSNISEDLNEEQKKNVKLMEKTVIAEEVNHLNLKTNSYLTKKHSAEQLLKWKKRLEEKENKLRELEKKANAVTATKSKMVSTKKIAMKDRSTSPFQFPQVIKSISEVTPSISELIEPKKSSIISEKISESISKTVSSEKSESVPEKIQSSISEDIPEKFSKNINDSTFKTMEYNSESFESLSSSEATKTKSATPRFKSIIVGHKKMPIKLSLSPKIQSSKRRYSSGSDDSLNFSFNETASEQSDLEYRIAALREQLRKRKLEAEKLRQEQKKIQREKLQVKEQSLLNQIKAYDAYIQKKKQELQQEYEHTSKTIVKPLIKQPRVDKKSNLKFSDSVFNENTNIKEKENIVFPAKKSESDSEIQEYIKEISESIKEDLKVSPESIQEDLESLKDKTESKTEEEIDSKVSATIPDLKTSLNETSDTAKSNSFSESIHEQEEGDGTQSESEDQSLSIKTTFHSPIEKPKSDLVESVKITGSISPSVVQSESISQSVVQSESISQSVVQSESISQSVVQSELISQSVVPLESINQSQLQSKSILEEESSKKETIAEDAYQFDSFESDIDENQSVKTNEVQKQSDSKTICSEIEMESLLQIEEKEEVQEENTSLEEKKSSSTNNDSNIIEQLSKGLDIADEIEIISDKDEKVEKISDSIIFDLIKESLEIFLIRKVEVERKLEMESKLNLETLSTCLAKEIIAEAVDDMLKIYNRKAFSTNKVEVCTPFKYVKTEVSKKTIQMKEKKKEISAVPQNVITTSTSPTEEGETHELEKRNKFHRSLNFALREKEEEEEKKEEEIEEKDKVFQKAEGNHEESKTENEKQEWLNDDLNLSRTKKEAEELRLQELQIEQEIQQLQAQQERVPYFYLREIPNKPPPPYTPPGKLPSEIPTSQSDIMAITKSAVQILVNELNNGKTMADIKPTKDFYGNVTNEHVKCYKLFLFDLSKQLIENVLRHQEKKEEVLPWLRTRERLSLFKYKNVERTIECLNRLVEKQVLTFFGFGKKVGKESLIDKWIRKKRDHVDEILVGESQEEESEWTDYEEDQVTVKNEVTLAILDNLLEESADIVNVIFNKKIKNFK